MDDRFNTIAGWVLFAGIVGLGSSIVAGELFHSERPEKMGYPIEGVAQEGAEGGAAAEQPIEFYLASADPVKGADTFKKCAACHNADKGGANQLGPNLWGVLGEGVGVGHGFAFSDALAKKGGTWNFDNLATVLVAESLEPADRCLFNVLLAIVLEIVCASITNAVNLSCILSRATNILLTGQKQVHD